MWIEGHGNAGRQLKTDGASQLCISTDTTSKPSVPSGSVCIHSAGMPACMEGQPGSESRRIFRLEQVGYFHAYIGKEYIPIF